MNNQNFEIPKFFNNHIFEIIVMDEVESRKSHTYTLTKEILMEVTGTVDMSHIKDIELIFSPVYRIVFY